MNTNKLEEAAQRMQEDIAREEENMATFMAMGKSSDGFVAVEMNGYHEIQNIRIDAEMRNIDKSRLCNSLKEAFNNAIDQVGIELEKRMSSIVYKYTEETVKNGQAEH